MHLICSIKLWVISRLCSRLNVEHDLSTIYFKVVRGSKTNKAVDISCSNRGAGKKNRAHVLIYIYEHDYLSTITLNGRVLTFYNYRLLSGDYCKITAKGVESN